MEGETCLDSSTETCPADGCQGAVFAWPLLLEQRTVLPAPKVAEAVWAASAVPSPPKEGANGVGLTTEGPNPISRDFF